MTIRRWLLAAIAAVGLVLTSSVAAQPEDGGQAIGSQTRHATDASYAQPGVVLTWIPPVTVLDLELVPTEASPEAPVTATVIGLDCAASDVVVTWEPEGVTWSAPIDLGDGTVTATTTVPGSFAAGPHEVAAECQSYESPTPVRETLTVATSDEVTPSLSVDPSSGAAGSTTTATATGHWCDTDVVFTLDGVEVGRAQTDESGTATTPISVPSDVATGSHELRAECAYDGFPWEPVAFTVTGVVSPPTSVSSPVSTAPSTPGSGPTSPPGPTSTGTSDTTPTSGTTSWEDPWWPAAVVLAALLVTSLLVLRPGRGARWARGHVRAVAGSAAGAGVALVESPGGPGWPDISIRIEPHPDSGTQSIEEDGP